MKRVEEILEIVEGAVTYRVALIMLFLFLTLDISTLSILHLNILDAKFADLEDIVGIGKALAVVVALSGILSLAAPILWHFIERAASKIRIWFARFGLVSPDTNWWLQRGYVKVDTLWDVAVKEQSSFMLDIASKHKDQMDTNRKNRRQIIHISIGATLLLMIDTFHFGSGSVTRIMLATLGTDLGSIAMLAAITIAAGRWLVAAIEVCVGAENDGQWVRFPELADRIYKQRSKIS